MLAAPAALPRRTRHRPPPRWATPEVLRRAALWLCWASAGVPSQPASPELRFQRQLRQVWKKRLALQARQMLARQMLAALRIQPALPALAAQPLPAQDVAPARLKPTRCEATA